MRYFIELSYLGTAYNGWQKQNNSLGVQELIENALSKVLRQEIEIMGSSRTDTGVHAEQQFAHFDIETVIDNCEMIVYKLNGMLPRDIAVQRIVRVSDDLNSRFVATHRRYEYRITTRKNPFLTGLAHLLKSELDVHSMNETARLILGLHDFESFSKIHTNVNNFRCSVSRADWRTEGDMLIFTIQANRFLRGMVRAIVGTMLEVGRGRRSIASFQDVLDARNRKSAGPQAPAEGLFLVEVGYDPAIFDMKIESGN